MSVIAVFTDDLWPRLIPAAIIVLGIPLVAAERLAHDKHGQRRRGLATDVLAIVWMGFSLIFIVGAFQITKPLLVHEFSLLSETQVRPAMPALSFLVRSHPPSAQLEASSLSEQIDEPDGGISDDQADAGLDAAVESQPETDIPDADFETEADVEQAPPPELPVLNLGQIRQRIAFSLVTLSIRYRNGRESSASGVIIDEQGRIATAYEALRNAEAVAVKLADGTWEQNIRTIVFDQSSGVALIESSEYLGSVAAELGDSEELELNDLIYCFGNPVGLEITSSRDRMATRLDLNGSQRLILSSSQSMNFLGGPAMNVHGQVVGLVVTAPNVDRAPRRRLPKVVVPSEYISDLMDQQSAPSLRLSRGQTPPFQW